MGNKSQFSFNGPKSQVTIYIHVNSMYYRNTATTTNDHRYSSGLFLRCCWQSFCFRTSPLPGYYNGRNKALKESHYSSWISK